MASCIHPIRFGTFPDWSNRRAANLSACRWHGTAMQCNARPDQWSLACQLATDHLPLSPDRSQACIYASDTNRIRFIASSRRVVVAPVDKSHRAIRFPSTSGHRLWQSVRQSVRQCGTAQWLHSSSVLHVR